MRSVHPIFKLTIMGKRGRGLAYERVLFRIRGGGGLAYKRVLVGILDSL